MVKRRRESAGAAAATHKLKTARRDGDDNSVESGKKAAWKKHREVEDDDDELDSESLDNSDEDDDSENEFGSDSNDDEMEEEEEEDQQEEEEEGQQEEDGEETSTKKYVNKNISAQEVQAAREAPELFKSSLFKLKIDEVMKNVKISEKSSKKMDKILFKLHSLIEAIPSTKQLSLDEAESVIKKVNSKIAIPFSDPKPGKDIKYSFQYLPPKVNVVGSFSLKTHIKQPDGNGIDMVVVMPKDLIQPKDFLNYRYLHKRAFYIAYLVSQLQALSIKEELPFVFSYKFFNDDPLKPIICVSSAPGKSDFHFASSKFTLQILVALPEGVFDYKKLGADKNSVRVQKSPNADADSVVAPATPLYNHAILTDATYLPYNEFLHRSAADCEAFKDACLLGKLWLYQRGFSSPASSGGFGHFEWAMTAAVLLNGARSDTHTLMKGYSSYQIFKGILQFFATVDLIENEVTFSVSEGHHSKFQKHHTDGPTITDRDYSLNILANMTKSNYTMLRHEAAVTCDMLSDNTKDRFDFIFLKKTFVPELRYDTYFTVELPIPSDDLSYTPLEKIRYPSYKRYFTEKLFNILNRGYTNRVVITHLVCKETPSWGLERRRMHEVKSGDTVTIGLILNDQECENPITYAPSPQPGDDEKATKAINARFDKFWGAKSEIRQFAGGDLKFVVSWEANPHKFIVSSITEYLLEEYFGSSTASSLKACNQKLLDMIHVPDIPNANKLPVNGVQLFSKKHDSFLALANILMSSESGVNMRISRVTPISSSLRNASIAAPAPFDITSDDSVGWGLIEFETSQKWPETVFAIEQTKTAFLLAIAEKLADMGVYKASVGTEKGVIIPTDKIRFLQVQCPEGYIFRFRIKTEVDEYLYEEWDKRTKTTSYLAKYKQKYTGAQTHTMRIQTLSRRFPFYSAAVRLLKSWFNRHMLTSHIREELIELIALKPFVDSAPYIPPSSPVSAFFRSLEFLASWNWKEEPLVLDVFKTASKDSDDDSATFNKISAIEGVRMDMAKDLQLKAAFQHIRKSDPGLVHCTMFIGTRDDNTGILWSQQMPPSQVGIVAASRMTALARAAHGVLMSPRHGDGAKIAQILFEPSLGDFDIVLNVCGEEKLGGGGDKSQKKKKSSSSAYRNLRLVTSFPKDQELASRLNRPVELFYNDLVEKYKGSVIFFHGTLDNSDVPGVIAGVWNQGVAEPTPFKVSLGYSTIPVAVNGGGAGGNKNGKKGQKNGKGQAGSNLVVLNKQAVVEEIKQMGGPLIEHVDLRQ